MIPTKQLCSNMQQQCRIFGRSVFCILALYFFITINPVANALENCDHLTVKFANNSDVNAPTFCPIGRDCKAWFDAGIKESGIYPVKPDNGKPFQVYCDMKTNGGGWTVFQRRQDGSVNFYRKWADYEKGFGNLKGEFWLGLSKMHRLTSSGAGNTLRIDLGDFSSNHRYAQYGQFEILDSYAKYALVVHKYTGNGGDSLSYHNLMKFSTLDQDNDRQKTNCAAGVKGAWWFNACFASHLNGQYKKGGSTPAWHGVIWYGWRGSKYSLKTTEMKVRRNK